MRSVNSRGCSDTVSQMIRVAVVAVALAACGRSAPAGSGSGSGFAMVAPPRDAAPHPDAALPVAPHMMKRSDETLAIRCSTDDGPLLASRSSTWTLHRERSFSLAMAPNGDVYTSDGVTLARWKLEVTHGACALHADPTYGTGGKLDIPILHNWNYDSNIAQGYCTLPRVHHYPTGNQCESTWRLSASPGGAVYMVDTILGIYRIDRGTVEPTCPTNGWTRLVFDAKGRAVADLAEELDLATCKVTKLPWALTEQKNGPMTLLAGFIGTEPIIDRDAMFHGTTQYGHRYGEGDSDRICQTAMAFPCGDDVCFADSGCMKVSRFTFDGRFRGAWTLSGRDTSPVPERMLSSSRTPAGDLLMLTVHRYWREGTQRPDDKFEVWPTLMPAAAFTP